MTNSNLFQSKSTPNFYVIPSCYQNASTHPIVLHRPALQTLLWCWNASSTSVAVRDGWPCRCTDIQSSPCYEMMLREFGEVIGWNKGNIFEVQTVLQRCRRRNGENENGGTKRRVEEFPCKSYWKYNISMRWEHVMPQQYRILFEPWFSEAGACRPHKKSRGKLYCWLFIMFWCTLGV